jgi:hypothetical protein
MNNERMKWSNWAHRKMKKSKQQKRKKLEETVPLNAMRMHEGFGCESA